MSEAGAMYCCCMMVFVSPLPLMLQLCLLQLLQKWASQHSALAAVARAQLSGPLVDSPRAVAPVAARCEEHVALSAVAVAAGGGAPAAAPLAGHHCRGQPPSLASQSMPPMLLLLPPWPPAEQHQLPATAAVLAWALVHPRLLAGCLARVAGALLGAPKVPTALLPQRENMAAVQGHDCTNPVGQRKPKRYSSCRNVHGR